MIRLQANPEERCSLTHGESIALALSVSSRERKTNGFGARGTKASDRLGTHPVLSYQQTAFNQNEGNDPEGWPMLR